MLDFSQSGKRVSEWELKRACGQVWWDRQCGAQLASWTWKELKSCFWLLEKSMQCWPCYTPVPYRLWWDEGQVTGQAKTQVSSSWWCQKLSSLDGAEARNRTVPGMGDLYIGCTKHNLSLNFIFVKKYVLVKLFIFIPLRVFLRCFVKFFVFWRTSPSKSLHENSLFFSLLFKTGKEPPELGSFRK